MSESDTKTSNRHSSIMANRTTSTTPPQPPPSKDSRSFWEKHGNTVMYTGAALGAAAVGFGTFAFFRYRVARADQMIVKTGWRVNGISVHKRTLQLPFQDVRTIDLAPHSIHLDFLAMSREYISCKIPLRLTVAPRISGNDPNSEDHSHLIKFATRMSGMSYRDIERIIEGVVTGESRILSASMSIEELFNDRETFQKSITESIDRELEPFGLRVCNSNIQELDDYEGSEYFEYMRKRALETAVNKARIDVAEARKAGDQGEYDHQGQARRRVAEIETETKVAENEREKEKEKSNAELEVAKADFKRQIEVAKAEADAAAQKRQAELQAEVESVRKEQEIQRLRAQDFSATQIRAEVRIREAEGIADAAIKEAEGRAQAKRLMADADRYAQEQHAEGIRANLLAEAEGLAQRVKAAGGDINGLNAYNFTTQNIWQDIAAQNAKALQGLNPKVTIWNTGSGSDTGKALSTTIQDVVKSIPPLVSTIEDQTGFKIAPDLLKRVGVVDGKVPPNVIQNFKKLLDEERS